MNKGRQKIFTFLLLGLAALVVLGTTATVIVVKNNQEKKSNSLVKVSQQKQNNIIKKPKERSVINSQQVNNQTEINKPSLPKPTDFSEKPVNLPESEPVLPVDQSPSNREPEQPKEQTPLNYSLTPAKPKPGKKVVAIKNGKAQVPREWLDTWDQTEINNLIFSSIYGSNWGTRSGKSPSEEINIHHPGASWWGNFLKKGHVNYDKSLKDLKVLEQEKPKSEIIFVFVSVDAFHFSLLVYKKSDNLWRHYDSLGSCNFSQVKARTINNENLQNVPCPQQSSDGWGSCGTYPPIIFSILLKRYNNKQLNNPDDWKISDEEFRTERVKFMDII